MASKIKEIEKQVLQSTDARARIIGDKFLHSLDQEDEEEDPDAELLWIEEMHRRYDAYKMGKNTAKPAEQVFQDARFNLQ